MPNRTLAVAVLACVSAITTLTGCESNPETRTGGRPLPSGALVAVIGTSETNPNWPGIRGGARRYDAQYPNVTCLTAAPEDTSTESLMAVVDRVCEKQPLAICLCVEDADRARAAAKKIQSRPILLVTIGTPVEGVNAYGGVEVGWPEGASLLGRALSEVAGDPPNPNMPHIGPGYVLIHEDGKNPIASSCYARFIVGAEGNSRLSLLKQRNAAQTDRSQRDLVEGLLAEFPSVRLVVTLNPQPWLVLQPRLRLPSGNRFCTLAAPPRLWARLQSGEAAALVGPLDGEIGYTAVDMAVHAIMEIPGAVRRRVIPCHLVTADTLADFAAEYAAAADLDLAEILPFGAERPPADDSGGH